MLNKITFIAALLFLCSCNSNEEQHTDVQKEELTLKENHQEIWNADTLKIDADLGETKHEKSISALEEKMIAAGLVDIQSVDSTIHVDVKYATTDNFMGQVLYKDYHKVYLQKVVAERLAKAQKALQKIDPTLTLLVFDGTRPRSVQQAMWDALDTIPFNERVKFVSNPVNGSIHNYGCAVDLTIMNKYSKGRLDMGADYDDLRKIAYPRHEEKLLASGELTTLQVQNRKLLRQVMRAGGFWVIQTEWWHFNAFSRKKAAELFDIVE
jgi:D-alanyl-D-alanine dipeptidase